MPLAADAFDAVVCVTVLCHRSIVEPAAVVRELARVVRPGGVLCLWEPGVKRLHRAHDRVTHTGRRFSRRELAGFVTAAGLTLERSTGAYSFLVPAAAAKSLVERGEVASDLDRHAGGLRGVLGGLASAERRLLRRVDLPFGLSSAVVAAWLTSQALVDVQPGSTTPTISSRSWSATPTSTSEMPTRSTTEGRWSSATQPTTSAVTGSSASSNEKRRIGMRRRTN